MFKGSGKNLQWLGRDHNHSAHNNTLLDSFNNNHAAFLAKLRPGLILPAVVNCSTADNLQISFRNGHFKGDAVLVKPMSFNTGDSVLVELLEKTIGRDGRIFLKTKCLKKISIGHTAIKCKKCNMTFYTIEELSKHMEYSCGLNVCRHCGETYNSTTTKKEQYHSSKACIGEHSLPVRKKKRKKDNVKYFSLF